MQYQFVSANIVINALVPKDESRKKPVISVNTNNAFDKETLYQLSKINNIINKHLDDFNHISE